MKKISSVDELFSLLESGGGEAYFGEPVTVLEHSLQAAWFVQRKGGDDALVAAALLHDLGHLLHSEGEDAAEHGLDTQHEELAAAMLDGHMPAAVIEPIRFHVAAKRYLCYAEPRYLAQLSPASAQSLALQGGPMGAEEAEGFLASPHARASVTLRRADDAAKIEKLATPPLDHYRKLIEDHWS